MGAYNDTYPVHTAEIGCTMTEVDLATDADVVVSAVPCMLLGWYVNVAMSAHDVTLIDNVTSKLTIAASTAKGVGQSCYGAKFLTNLSVNSNDAATGKIVLFTRPI